MDAYELINSIRKQARAIKNQNLCPIRADVGRELERGVLDTVVNERVLGYLAPDVLHPPATLEGARIWGLPVRLVPGASIEVVADCRQGRR